MNLCQKRRWQLLITGDSSLFFVWLACSIDLSICAARTYTDASGGGPSLPAPSHVLVRKKVTCGGETIVSPQVSTGMVPLTANQRKTLESSGAIFPMRLTKAQRVLIIETVQDTSNQFLLLGGMHRH